MSSNEALSSRGSGDPERPGSSTKMLDAALAYAAPGVPIFPCLENSKKPATENGFKDATIDDLTIMEWFAENPNYNIGTCPADAGLFVLDIDPGADRSILKKLPETYTVRTPRGGFHLYFRGVGKSTASKLAPHVDTRSIGGYVLLPPSTVGGHAYVVEKDLPYAPLPEWICEAFATTDAPRETARPGFAPDQPWNISRAVEYLKYEPGAVEYNGSDDATIKVANVVGDLGVSQERALEIMWEHWVSRCEGDWTPDWLEEKIRSAYRSRQNEIGCYALGDTGEAFAKFFADMPKTRGSTISASALEGKPVPPREWVINGWLLKGSVASLYGDGGLGKSLTAMQALTDVSLGLPFFGLETWQMRGFGYFSEDTEAELHRRQADIVASLGIKFSDLKDLFWQSRVGCSNVLMKFLRDGAGEPTDAFAELRKEVLRIGARFVVLDAAADVFGGNEIIRPQVRQFINMLTGLALEIDGAVLLLAHPSAAGLARDDGTGGSTAWNNTVRARWYLNRPKKNDIEEMSEAEARGLRVLTKMKSNYASDGDKINLRWVNGAFRLETADAISVSENVARASEDEKVFLKLLDALNKQGRFVSASSNSSNFAPKKMAEFPEGKTVGIPRLKSAMGRLFTNQIIEIGHVGRDLSRRPKDGIRRAGGGVP